MRIGIGLPAAAPEVDATQIGEWAAVAEGHGFESLGVIDRLVYDNLEPLTALAAAAARTERVELLTTVLNVNWRQNALLLAKQLASVDLLSGGRLTAGLGMGGWPEDHEASEVPLTGKGARHESMLATMRRAWAGEVTGAAGPMPAMPPGRPEILFAGLVQAGYTRAATRGQGWVAPLMGYSLLTDGAQAVREAWAAANRAGQPRIVTGRYFCLGDGADKIAYSYLEHYYGSEGAAYVSADMLTSRARVLEELPRLAEAGCTDVVLYPCSPDIEQVKMLAAALDGVLVPAA